MTATVEHHVRMPHRIELRWSDDATAWVAEFPELRGCRAQGTTPAVAVERAYEMKRLWIEAALAAGDVVPAPGSAVPAASHDAEVDDESDAFDSIFDGTKALGWSVFVPACDDVKADLPGLSIGSDEYLSYVAAAIEAYDRQPPWKIGH